jgi:transposase
MKARGNFLSKTELADLEKIARDGLEEHRIARRANAIILLNRGMKFEDVAQNLLIDDSTVRAWLGAFEDGGVEAIVMFDLKGGFSPLSSLQLDELGAWATEVLPTSTTEVGKFVKERFGLDYTRSGLIKLMNRVGFDWQKPEAVPGKIDADAQKKFIDAHEDLRNSLMPDEAIVYVDAVHPTHQARFADAGCRAASAARSPRRPDETG